MATLSHAESRQLYSWWWDSHISPKNSKWLQENLTDMNLKVKMMIKLIEEDADSFRKRAEMYYRKRPELMKLVVEFYRAYRALAGRYDHATGALRQAHRTMAEAFPDQIPLILLDESPPGPSSTDAELYTPEMHSHDREQRDAVDMSSRSAAFRGSGLYSELTDAATSEEGSWKSTTGEEFANGWARNRLPSQNTEGKSSGEKVQQAVQILSEENQNLKNQIAHETERADKAVAEVGNLKGTISKLESEQEDVSLQYKLALENISHDIERADKAETEVGYLKGTFSKRDTEMEDVSLQYKLAREKISHEIERADQAEAEVGYLKGNISKLESEKEGVSLQYRLAREKISHETERADKAEAEVEYLKGTISKLESEKKDVSLQCQLALEKIASLEADISRIQEDFKKLNDEMVSGTSKSRSLEDRCYQLEKENQSLQLELGMLKEMAKNQQEELGMKQEETEKLNISINEERERAMQAEMTRLSLEKLHSQSQEEVRGLSLEIQNWVEKLMNVEMSKVGLEEEIQRLRGEIDSLNEQIRSSSLKIKSLQDEISLLEELKKKLQDEEGVHVEEKKSLQQEILSIKADKKALEQRHHELTEQIGAVNLNVESLQTMVKELRDGNVELKELCRKHEDERVLHLQSLKFMEKITKRNVALENSLSNANAELEELREKVKTLQESCEALWRKMSMHISEKAVLMSQIEAIVRNMEKLSEKNTLLENSLSDVNVELEGLRSKLNVLEESCQSLRGQNSCLLDEKGALITQVESISQSLENLESRYAELEGKNLNLERERDHILHQVRELQNSLRIQKEEYETLALSSRSQLDALEDQICILQERGRLREDELEVEHHKIINAQIENFVLQRILHDMKDNNVILSDKCQEYLETSRCQEELISELKQESFIQKDRLTWLSQYNDRLVEGIYQVMRALKVSKECSSPDVLHFNLILLEIEDLKGSILDAQDENQHLVLEKSVILTLLEQYRLDLAELQSEKNVLEQESKTRFEELLALQSKEHQFLGLNEQLRQNLQACTQREEVLMGLNEQLRQNLQACTQREEVLMAEVEILCKKLSDVQEAHSALQSDTTKLMEENKSFSRKINDLSMENDTLEERNSALIAETVNLEHLYLVFRSYNAERALELQLLKDNMDRLHGDTSGLEQEIISLNEKLGAAEIENMILKESLLSLEECKRCLLILEDEFRTVRDTCQDLDLQIEIGKNFLIQKDMELLQVSHGFQAVQDKNTELSGQIEGLMMEVDQAKAEREELEKKNLTLLEHNTRRDNEIADLHQSNDTLNEQLDKLIEEGEGLKKMEKHLTAELEDRIQEPKSCEVEIETLLGDIHVTTVKTETFEDKMLELLITCESLEISAMVQQQMFYEEIGRRSAYEEKLKERLDTLDGENRGLKEEQSAYLPLILSFGDFVTSLERRILPLANHSSLSNQEKKDGSQLVQQEKSNEEGNEDHHAFSSFGIFDLQKLHAKVNALNQVVIDILNDLEQDRYASKTTSQAAVSEGEGLKALEAAPIGKDIILHLKKREETANLKKGNAETYKEKSEQIMKDIQLDHVLSSHYEKGSSSHAPSACGSDETKDQMMELWETVDCNTMEKTSPVTLERDLECHQIEAVQEEKSVYSSCKLAAEKELNIDGLELTKKTESHREWSGSITDRLPSEAQRLSVLQKSTQELKKNMEASELSTVPTSFEFKKIKAQLKEAEAAISQLIDTNSKLTRKAEKLTSSSNNLGSEYIDEIGNTSERKISGQAQRGAEKIGRLELKLQKLEYIWVKLKEEHDYKRARAGDRRTRVLLIDYLCGKREGLRRMRVHCCACIRPRTRDESE